MLRPALSRALFTLCAVAALCALLLAGLGHPIQNNNEGLYASVARGMLEDGSWIVPHLDGVAYLEKPPLLYWITALGYAAFGVSEASSRIAPLIGSMLALAAVFWFARRHWGRSAAIAAVFIAASCPLVVALGRTLMFDMLFTGLYTWALVLMHEALARGERWRRWMRLAYAALALAVLAKGWLAVALFVPIAAAGALLARRDGAPERARRLLDPVALAIFALVALPWHLAAWSEQPGFGWFYFWNEHVLRFLDRREPHDYYHGPPWYYLPRLLASTLPWIVLLLVPAQPRKDARERVLRGFLWACVLVPLAFFSASAAKANYYMIVAIPPLALILARRAAALRDTRWPAIAPAAWIAILGSAWLFQSRLGAEVRVSGLALAVAVALACVSSAFLLSRRMLEGVVACAAMALPLAVVASGYLAAHEDRFSARIVAAELRKRGFDEVYLYRDLEAISAIAYYWHRPLGVIDSASNELAYGLRLRRDDGLFPTAAGFAAAAHAGRIAIVATGHRRRALESSAIGARLVRVAHIGDIYLYEWRAPDSTLRTVAR